MCARVDVDELRHPARLKRYAPIQLRLRAVILSLEGQQQKRIAAQLDRWPAWVKRWTDRFKAEGVEGLFDRPRSGRPTKLARDREESFRARVPAGPRPEDIVRVRRGKDLQRILEEAMSELLGPERHGVVIVDGAGWHGPRCVSCAPNITLLFLPPYSPQLNSIERLWRWIKRRFLSNTVFETLEALVDQLCEAWRTLTPDLIQTLCRTEWIESENHV